MAGGGRSVADGGGRGRRAWRDRLDRGRQDPGAPPARRGRGAGGDEGRLATPGTVAAHWAPASTSRGGPRPTRPSTRGPHPALGERPRLGDGSASHAPCDGGAVRDPEQPGRLAHE